MRNKQNIKFILKINDKLMLNNSLQKILKFEINRIENKFTNSVIIYDPKKLVKEFKTHSKKDINKIFSNSDKHDRFLIVDTINPYLDFDLIKKMIEFSKKSSSVISEGSIPGTSPDICVDGKDAFSYFNSNFSQSKSVKIYWDTHQKYNTQFNLNLPIRIKIFLKIIDKLKNLHKLNIKQFIQQLESDSMINYILRYGEEMDIKNRINCPNCFSKNLKQLYHSTSQPTIGFIPCSVSVYSECINCKLVFLNQQCNINDLHKYYDDFERPKVNQREIINKMISKISATHFEEKIIVMNEIRKRFPNKAKIADLGCGFGEFVCLLKNEKKEYDVTGIDFELSHIEKILKSYGIHTRSLNFLTHEMSDKFDVITLMHVIEHIPFIQISKFIKNIHNALHDDGVLIISTPNYNSPLAKMYDYHLAYPPIHQTIFSSEWIINFLEEKNLFKKITVKSASVILENYDNWFNYYRNNAPNDDIKSFASFLDIIKNDEKINKKIIDLFNRKNLGSETIIVLKKI